MASWQSPLLSLGVLGRFSLHSKHPPALRHLLRTLQRNKGPHSQPIQVQQATKAHHIPHLVHRLSSFIARAPSQLPGHAEHHPSTKMLPLQQPVYYLRLHLLASRARCDHGRHVLSDSQAS